MKSKESEINSLQQAKLIAGAIEDKKGADIRIIDVTGVSPICDIIVIASADSAPQLKALQGEILKQMKDATGSDRCRTAGDPDSAWIVIDFFDVIVHLFLPEAREYYAIEDLWKNGKEIPIKKSK